MTNIFIDTNILIDYSKGYEEKLKPLIKSFEQGKINLYINSIVVIEFMNDLTLTNNEKIEKTKRFLNYFSFIEIDKKTSFITAKLLRTKQIDYLADALIAANCLQHSLFLFTKNKKDFKKVKGLKFYQEREAFKKSSKIK